MSEDKRITSIPHIVTPSHGDTIHARPTGVPKFVNRPNLSGAGTLNPGVATGGGGGGASGGTGTSGNTTVPRPWGLIVLPAAFLGATCANVSDGIAQLASLFASIPTMAGASLTYNSVASPLFDTNSSGESVTATLICMTTPDAALAYAANFIATYVGAVNNYQAAVTGYVATTVTGQWPTVAVSFRTP